MPTFGFRVIVTSDVPPEAFDGRAFVLAHEGPLFEAFGGDVAPAVTAGVPLLDCTVEAPSLDAAVRHVLDHTEQLGLVAERIEVEPEAFTAQAA